MDFVHIAYEFVASVVALLTCWMATGNLSTSCVWAMAWLCEEFPGCVFVGVIWIRVQKMEWLVSGYVTDLQSPVVSLSRQWQEDANDGKTT